MKVEHLVSIQDGFLLAIIYSGSKCYQYQIILDDHSIYCSDTVFYHQSTAYKVGVERVKILIEQGQ